MSDAVASDWEHRAGRVGADGENNIRAANGTTSPEKHQKKRGMGDIWAICPQCPQHFEICPQSVGDTQTLCPCGFQEVFTFVPSVPSKKTREPKDNSMATGPPSSDFGMVESSVWPRPSVRSRRHPQSWPWLPQHLDPPPYRYSHGHKPTG